VVIHFKSQVTETKMKFYMFGQCDHLKLVKHIKFSLKPKFDI